MEHGKWSEEQIVDHASTFLDDLIKERRSLRLGADIRAWACIYLHKVFQYLYVCSRHVVTSSLNNHLSTLGVREYKIQEEFSKEYECIVI